MRKKNRGLWMNWQLLSLFRFWKFPGFHLAAKNKKNKNITIGYNR